MSSLITLVPVAKGTVDPILGCEIEAVITVEKEDEAPISVAAFRYLHTARGVLRAEPHIQMLEDLLVHMAETIDQLEAELQRSLSRASALSEREDQLIKLLNGRKALAKTMAGNAIKKLLADDPDDEELRARLERVSRRFGGQS